MARLQRLCGIWHGAGPVRLARLGSVGQFALGMAWPAWHGVFGQCWVRARRGRGMAGRAKARPGLARSSRVSWARSGGCRAWLGWLGKAQARRSKAGLGRAMSGVVWPAGHAWQDLAWSGGTRWGKAGRVWLGGVGQSPVRRGTAGNARQGRVGLGTAMLGQARLAMRGKATPCWHCLVWARRRLGPARLAWDGPGR